MIDDEGVKSNVAEIDAKMSRISAKLAVFGKLLRPKAEAVALEIAKESADKLEKAFKKREKRLTNFYDELHKILVMLEEQIEEIKKGHFVKEEDKKDIIKILESMRDSYFKSMGEVIDFMKKYDPLFQKLMQQSEEITPGKKRPKAYIEMGRAYKLLEKAMQGTLNALEKPGRRSKVEGAIDILNVEISDKEKDYRGLIKKQFEAAHLKVLEALDNFLLWRKYQAEFKQKVEALRAKLSERGSERAKEIYKARAAPPTPPPAT